MACQIVTLNVGGTHFCTSCDTLQREPSSKLALITRGVLPSVPDEWGHTFIDRDARFFQAILNYLRDGWALLPASASDRRELMQEARFYQVCQHRAQLSQVWEDHPVDLALHAVAGASAQTKLLKNIQRLYLFLFRVRCWGCVA